MHSALISIFSSIGLFLLLSLPAISQVAFEPMPESSGLANTTLTFSAAVFDANNDGWPDLHLNKFAIDLANPNSPVVRSSAQLLLNMEGLWSRRTKALSPWAEWDTGGSALPADFDNDGDLDLYIPRIRGGNQLEAIFNGSLAFPDLLLENRAGIFYDVTAESGLNRELHTEGAIAFDYDKDGMLDLYLITEEQVVTSNEIEEDKSLNEYLDTKNNVFFRGHSPMSFIDYSANTGLGLDMQSIGLLFGAHQGALAADFDGNSWPDLFVGTLGGGVQLFLNDAMGGFTLPNTSELNQEFATGVAFGDIDNNGTLDLFIPSPAVFFLATAERVDFRSSLQLNLGGQFIDVTDGSGLGEYTRATDFSQPVFIDLDNDADLDLVSIVSGDIFSFYNNGDGTFSEPVGLGINRSQNVILSMSIIDFNLDGFLDIVAGYVGQNLLPAGFAAFRNTGNNNHWLRLELAGTISNRNGIGARVWAYTGDLRQMREMVAGAGSYGLEEQVAHFGLGTYEQVDRLEIQWPSGQVDVLTDVLADQRIRVIEGQGTYHVVQPAQWGIGTVDSLVAGLPQNINLEVIPGRFEADAVFTRAIADLSAIGGPAVVPLKKTEDGRFQLANTPVEVNEQSGYQEIAVLVEQETSLGPHWARLYRDVLLLPATALEISGNGISSWQLENSEGVTQIKLGDQDALDISGRFRFTYASDNPVDASGYEAVQFLIYTELMEEFVTNSIRISLDFKRTSSLFPTGNIGIDIKPGENERQVIHIPLKDLDIDNTHQIRTLSFNGNIKGSIKLAKIQLVPAQIEVNTAVAQSPDHTAPQAYLLAQNYPNPFNSNTTIRLAIPASANIQLALYNLAGQKLATLLDGPHSAGTYTVHWDGRDNQGRILASGIYLYRLQTGAQTQTRKLVIVR